MLKNTFKVLAVVLLVFALLGGADPLVAEFTTDDGGQDAVAAAPFIGVVGSVAADPCPDGHSGC